MTRRQTTAARTSRFLRMAAAVLSLSLPGEVRRIHAAARANAEFSSGLPPHPDAPEHHRLGDDLRLVHQAIAALPASESPRLSRARVQESGDDAAEDVLANRPGGHHC